MGYASEDKVLEMSGGLEPANDDNEQMLANPRRIRL
jgi:hypothetical protein